jgi:GNAT superfamily N-acetyltransferase
MWWRRKRSDFERGCRGGGVGNRRALKRLVDAGEVPGVLAYEGRRAVAWCSIAPRHRYGPLNRSRVLKRLDEVPVWSLVCLFVAKDRRGSGVALELVKGAVAWAAKRGAKVIEAYPKEPKPDGEDLPPVSSFMGVPSLFERIGFEEVARPAPGRVVMRLEVG